MPRKSYAHKRSDVFRSIPAMDKCLKAMLQADPSLAQAPKPLLVELATSFWNKIREKIKKGECPESPDLENKLPELLAFVRNGLKPNLRPVLNATGVIIHTNLGRSILSESACNAVLQAARGYTSLEMDLQTGERGSRHSLTRDLLQKLTGAEDSLVVNNNAAGVLLVLDTLCAGGETIVSRGELVEIGGSFRIPDIMAKSGSILKEVGTTNRTNLDDYRNAINEHTKALMRVHASNFRIIGFHSSVDLKSLKTLALEHDLPLIFDLGSGSLLDFSECGLPAEPTVGQVLDQGADIVCFSGDKVLGGPQAGIIAGKTKLVEKIRKNPLLRVLRCDKLCLAALEATLRLYLDLEQAKNTVPTPAMISIGAEALSKKAHLLVKTIRRAFKENHIACEIKLKKDSSRVGGGSFPEYELPTTLVCLYPADMSAQELRQKLLKSDILLIGRLEKDAFCLDPRTLSKTDYNLIVKMLVNVLGKKS